MANERKAVLFNVVTKPLLGPVNRSLARDRPYLYGAIVPTDSPLLPAEWPLEMPDAAVWHSLHAERLRFFERFQPEPPWYAGVVAVSVPPPLQGSPAAVSKKAGAVSP